MTTPEYFKTGQQYQTVSGAITTPFPRVDYTTSRRANNTMARARQWMADNACMEAERRQDDFNLPVFRRMTPKTMHQADIDSTLLYLWDAEMLAITRQHSTFL